MLKIEPCQFAVKFTESLTDTDPIVSIKRAHGYEIVIKDPQGEYAGVIVPMSLRHCHSADKQSIQDALERLSINHYIFDGLDSSLMLIPLNDMDVVVKVMECGGIKMRQ